MEALSYTDEEIATTFAGFQMRQLFGFINLNAKNMSQLHTLANVSFFLFFLVVWIMDKGKANGANMTWLGNDVMMLVICFGLNDLALLNTLSPRMIHEEKKTYTHSHHAMETF